MVNQEFPAVSWLGYSLDMTGATPMDITAATNAIQTVIRIVAYDIYDTRPVEVDGVTYDVPKAVAVAQDEDSDSGNTVNYSTGNAASEAFNRDPALAVRYFAVTGDPSVATATGKIFRRDNQYSFYNYSKNKYMALLRDFITLLNDSVLVNALNQLPMPFNGQNESVVKKYKDFFQRYGTHVVTKVRYGARMQLNVWASNDFPEVNKVWATDVNAEFGGIPSGGVYDPSVQSQAQYKTFREIMQKLVSVQGGNKEDATEIVVDPSSYSKFQEWTRTVDTRTSLLGVVTTELWSLMRSSINPDLNKYAETVQEAFEFIINNPKLYRTAVTLDVQSDWAEFGLITPSAVIVKGDTVPDMTQLSETKVTWGKERSHDYRRETIKFFVINDGYPIDFYISHGSSGSQSSNGTAQVIMEGEHYVNDQITDNNWNTMWFYQKPVSATAQNFTGRKGPKDGPDAAASAWDDLLTQYLHEREGKLQK